MLLGRIATINRFDIVHLLLSPLSCAYPNAGSVSKAIAAIVCDKDVVFISDDILFAKISQFTVQSNVLPDFFRPVR